MIAAAISGCAGVCADLENTGKRRNTKRENAMGEKATNAHALVAFRVPVSVPT